MARTVPPRRSRPFEMEVAPRHGELVFNAASPDDVKQGTLDELDGKAEPSVALESGGKSVTLTPGSVARAKRALKYDDLKDIDDK